MLQLPTALEHLNLEVSGTVPWQWSITHIVLLVLPFHYKHPLSCVWLCHTSAIQLDIFYALGWFLGVKLSQNPSFQPVNIKWLCQHLFLFFFLFFFFFKYVFQFSGPDSQLVSTIHNHCVPTYLLLLCKQIANCAESIMLSWYCKFSFRHESFFLSWVRACLGPGKDLRFILCDAKPESWAASCGRVWPRCGTNSAKIVLTLACFCMMLQVSELMGCFIWTTFPQVLIDILCFPYNFHLAFSPRNWGVTPLPRTGLSAQVVWILRHQRELHPGSYHHPNPDFTLHVSPHGLAHGWQESLNDCISVNFWLRLFQALFSFLLFTPSTQMRYFCSSSSCLSDIHLHCK